MIAKISDIADVQGGMVLSRKEAKSPEDTVCEYQRLTLRSFDETGNIDKVELETFHACESLENVLFTQTGDVVIRLVSPMYPVYIEAGYDGILVPSQFAVLRVKDNMEIAPEYLRLCLAQRIIQDRILNLESGTAQKTVKIKTVLDLEIPLMAGWAKGVSPVPRVLKMFRAAFSVLPVLLCWAAFLPERGLPPEEGCQGIWRGRAGGQAALHGSLRFCTEALPV